MADQPRKHHTVPQFYLAGFTTTDSKDGTLFILDKNQRKTWKSTPRQTAHKRDFHAIEAKPGGDPMIFEKTLAIFEDRWSTVVRQVLQTKTIPEDDSFGDLMMFVACMAVRVTRIREIQSDFVDRVSKAEIQATLATEEGRANFRKLIERDGNKLSEDEFQELVNFGLTGEFDVNFEQTWHVQQMAESMLKLAPMLSLRKWVLWIADDDAPDLICSDSPVAPTWASSVNSPYSPAFGTTNTIVSIPLNRRVALVSMIEAQLPARRLNRPWVAATNSATAMYANQLYSPEPEFTLMMNQQVATSGDLLKSLCDTEKEGEA